MKQTTKKKKLTIDELFQHIQTITQDTNNSMDDEQPFVFIGKDKDDKCYLVMPESPNLVRELFKTFALALMMREGYDHFEAIHDGLNDAINTVTNYEQLNLN